jgi:hypothetical protein
MAKNTDAATQEVPTYGPQELETDGTPSPETAITQDELAAKIAKHRTDATEAHSAAPADNVGSTARPLPLNDLDIWVGPCTLPQGGVCHDAACWDFIFQGDKKIKVSHCKYKGA